MGYWENKGKTNEWYTPEYVFEALNCWFNLDVAHPPKETNVPCDKWISENSLEEAWSGFVWMNPPFEGRNGLNPWLDKFIYHANGIALTPDRTSTAWWHRIFKFSDAVLFVEGKIKFIDENGEVGRSPSNGTTLFAIGEKGVEALKNAEKNGLGSVMVIRRKN